MAELVRLSRPWLLASIRAQTFPVAPVVARGFSSTSNHDRQTGPTRSSRQKMPTLRQPSFLLPSTLVTPPLSKFPRTPKEFAGFVYYIFKARLQAVGANIGAKIMSMPRTLLSRPKLKLGRSQAVPTGKALHVQMSEAVAAGDAETIRRICLPELADSLVASMQTRPRGIRYAWQLVKYNSTVSYPRLADFRAVTMPLPGSTQTQIVRQAVVSIASTQRIGRYDDTKGGTLVPGSERTQDLVEHLVLQSNVSMQTWVAEPWKIWGTINESTYQDSLDIEAGTKLLYKRQAKGV
ncbi:uncharacterized protein B0I36DRAFT_428220 [Microdochium trichocladiopsis]|uniref:Tim44-like domain-containing protein n=1 Tax=Microdochium trichocladiopsis TaxID=1682393 RepID=A0A9P9BU21_9PEZI|nr:uncharacterized protein B0I36DRAFT_428220 [Microdochium trichocladiopsis]KAH7037632.1 hypothetical protein B0I36DRAFT_428220 [Microdochium trichocladiopsis]